MIYRLHIVAQENIRTIEIFTYRNYLRIHYVYNKAIIIISVKLETNLYRNYKTVHSFFIRDTNFVAVRIFS